VLSVREMNLEGASLTSDTTVRCAEVEANRQGFSLLKLATDHGQAALPWDSHTCRSEANANVVETHRLTAELSRITRTRRDSLHSHRAASVDQRGLTGVIDVERQILAQSVLFGAVHSV
jgi:hypothetical protein